MQARSPYCQESTEYYFPLFAMGDNICKANTNPNKFLEFLYINSITKLVFFFSYLDFFFTMHHILL